MPALVNYSGDKDFLPGGPLYSNLTDSSLILSLAPCPDLYCSPRKRARISAPFVFRERFDAQKQCSIDVLPDECLFEIFRRLPEGQERSACACVSKRWLMLQSSISRSEICGSRSDQSVNPAEGKSLDREDADSMKISEEIESDGYLTRCLEGKKATDIRLAAMAVGTSSRGGLGKLLIRGNNSIRGATNIGLLAIARGCPSLRVLSLWNVSSIGDEGLYEIANGCPMLEKLDLCQCPSISDKGIIAIAKKCPNLTSITIDSCSKVGNGSLQTIGRCCPKLQSVSIKDCPLVGDQGVASLISAASPVLTKIKLQAVNVTDLSLAVIGHYGKAVTDLSLTGLQCVSEKGFWVLGNAFGLQKLKSVTIASCRGVTDLGLEALGKGCPELKLLCLRKCSFLSDDGLKLFTKSAASLETLQLEECNRITQVGIVGALSNCGEKLKTLALVKCMGVKDSVMGFGVLSPCKSLRSLSICNCPGFGINSLAMVGKLCPQLQNVDLSGLCSMTDDGLLPLLESCDPGIVKVNLSGCANLTDTVVSAMARLHGGTLQLINLDGCKNITDESLVAIVENCPLLRDLDMSRCAVSDYGVVALADAKELNLEILSLSGCSRVSDKSLDNLGNLGQSLVGLNLQHCNSISSGSGELLGERLWRCDILF